MNEVNNAQINLTGATYEERVSVSSSRHGPLNAYLPEHRGRVSRRISPFSLHGEGGS